MPIGKNAIKRVENNGYSKVASSAPDMENSHVESNVIANTDPQVIAMLQADLDKKADALKAKIDDIYAAAEAPAPKKTTAKKAPAKKAPAKKTACKKAEKGAFAYVNVGSDMPYYLL